MTVKSIPGYEGRYVMDENGDIHSLPRTITKSDGKIQVIKGGQLKPIKHRTGYLTIGLEGKTFRLHVLVARLLVPNPDDKPHVNHKDGNKHNYHPLNLEWVTPKENMQHASLNGLVATGERNGAAKLTDEEVSFAFDRVMIGYSVLRVANEFGVSRNTITKAFKRLPKIKQEMWKVEALRRKSPKVQKELY